MLAQETPPAAPRQSSDSNPGLPGLTWAALAIALAVVLAVLLPSVARAAGEMSADATSLPGKHVVLATSDTDNDHDKPIYREPSAGSDVIAKLQGRSCVVCDVSDSGVAGEGGFVRVALPNCDPSFGYVAVSDYDFGTIDAERFGLGLDEVDEMRVAACREGMSLLGASYSHEGSYSAGMCCNQVLDKCYAAAGLGFSTESARDYNTDAHGRIVEADEAKPGDIVHYRGLDGSAFSHVGLYLGDGYVLHATSDKGDSYPRAGVRITRAEFRSVPLAYRDPFAAGR